MSIARKCPYENENCKYEIFAGEPIFKKCKFCSRNSGNKGKQIEGVTMFDEESNNYADKYVTEGVDELKRKVIKGHWQDGAEFGYNKANEWHYPSKGEYPKVEGEYLVIFESDRTKYKGLESYYPDTKEWSTICKIIAWKEIVLPELPKEN